MVDVKENGDFTDAASVLAHILYMTFIGHSIEKRKKILL